NLYITSSLAVVWLCVEDFDSRNNQPYDAHSSDCTPTFRLKHSYQGLSPDSDGIRQRSVDRASNTVCKSTVHQGFYGWVAVARSQHMVSLDNFSRIENSGDLLEELDAATASFGHNSHIPAPQSPRPQPPREQRSRLQPSRARSGPHQSESRAVY